MSIIVLEGKRFLGSFNSMLRIEGLEFGMETSVEEKGGKSWKETISKDTISRISEMF